jgi:anthranilate synthase component 1
MNKYPLKTLYKTMLADTLTPVNIYLKLRDVYAGSLLLESSDYHGNENSLSFVCCDPIASFEVKDEHVNVQYPDGASSTTRESSASILPMLNDFVQRFIPDDSVASKYNPSGVFGFMSYDAIRFFEDVSIRKADRTVPDILYKLYRYVIVIDHFSNQLTLFEHRLADRTDTNYPMEALHTLQQIIFSNRVSTYRFTKTGEEQSNFSDEEFLKAIEKGKQHCFRGDVFQIVLSRRFSTTFKGDEFNVYRALRSINPSPYLFYFDYGSFKLFGSSPEAQIQVNNGKAYIYPIAGTFRRTGNDQEDLALAEKLAADEKENAEHVMLVDLARNDMSRNASEVNVEIFKEVQFYSHVIHLVSKVSGKLASDTSVIKLACDTFPAGTLSGAPKHEALKLIDRYENGNRGFYGGALGFIGFNNSFNHAIMIRTFLSSGNTLVYQAGAGIVAKSSAASELQEVNNKLGALRKAVGIAEEI